MEKFSPALNAALALPSLPGQVAVGTWAAGMQSVDSVHDHDEVCVMHTGTVRVTVWGEAVDVGPGEILYVPAGEPHSPEALTDVTMTYLALTPKKDWPPAITGCWSEVCVFGPDAASRAGRSARHP